MWLGFQANPQKTNLRHSIWNNIHLPLQKEKTYFQRELWVTLSSWKLELKFKQSVKLIRGADGSGEEVPAGFKATNLRNSETNDQVGLASINPGSFT